MPTCRLAEPRSCLLLALAACALSLPLHATGLSRLSGWVPLAPLPEARFNAAVAACGDRIYLVGGTTNTEPRSRAVRAYEPSSNSWTSLADYPGPPIRSAAAIGLDGYVYLFGGYLYDYEISAQVWRFDPANATWEERTPMPESRLHASLHELNGRIYLLGGRTTPAWQYRNTVFIYDPSQDIASPKADPWTSGHGVVLPTPLGDNSGASINGDLFTLGSYEPAVSGRFLMYSPRQDAWRALPASPLTTGAGVVRLRSRIYAIEWTGTMWSWEYTAVPGPGCQLQRVESGGGWDFPPFASEPQRPEAMAGAGVIAHNGRIYCLGGISGAITDHAWAFQP